VLISQEEYEYRVCLPLEDKILMTQQRITDFVEWSLARDVLPVVSFSGGVDSTVLLHLVRDKFPWVPGVFSNTGLEFPEIVSFARGFENICEVRPAVPFHRVIQKHGWPVVSKKVAHMVNIVRLNSPKRAASIRLYTQGLNRQDILVPRWKIPAKWMKLIDAPFAVSDACCKYMKKDPFVAFDKTNGPVGHITGQMATDSEQRRESYLRTGCNAFDASRGAKSNPMSFWTKQNVWDFVSAHGIQYCDVYDMGYSNTGCIYCGFGAHLDKGIGRFSRLKRTHPKQWEYVMNKLGMAEVLDYIGVDYN
jgi:3'-phosphoadenosine 5'-phosphosulfate sulfotransferase (PAPS reductase)/FAD synthetase